MEKIKTGKSKGWIKEDGRLKKPDESDLPSATGLSCPVCSWQGSPMEEHDNKGIPDGFQGPLIGYGCPSCGVKFSHLFAWERAR